VRSLIIQKQREILGAYSRTGLMTKKKGKIIKYFAIEEDVTAQKELESQKENLISDLAKTNKELEDYAQIVSHDLKSPLRSINSLISWIKEENIGNFDAPTQNIFH
jgi:signal transduction histidine kinase